MNSRQDEDDRVQRLLSLLDPAKEPESSDHVHDDTLALLTGGMASAEELAAMRAHLVVCPPCRRLVGRILGDSERSHPEVRPARTWGWLGRPPAILAWAVAACLLLGVTVAIWSLNRGGGAPRPGPQPGPDNAPLWAELLAATVTWERSGPRGIEPERSPITLKIDSPQDGIAVVVMAANGRWELLRGERPMKKGPGNDYGPIESLPAPVDYIVVLSDRQERGELSRTIRESLPSEPRDIEAHYETWRDDVRARLTRGGHRWVAVEPVRVVPTGGRKGDRGEWHEDHRRHLAIIRPAGPPSARPTDGLRPSFVPRPDRAGNPVPPDGVSRTAPPRRATDRPAGFFEHERHEIHERERRPV